MESTTEKDAVNIVEGTTRDLEYHIKFVDKAVAGFERIDWKVRHAKELVESRFYHLEEAGETKELLEIGL